MDLVREVLDKRILDRDGKTIGRVDGLIIALDGKARPRVTALSVGGPAVFARVGKWAVGLAKFLSAMWGPHRKSPARIAWSDIDHFGRDVKLAVSADEAGTMAWESWIRHHIIERIPGSGSK